MTIPDYFGVADSVRQLTPPPGLEAVHQDGFSWARQGRDWTSTTRISPAEWNLLIGQLRGLLTTAGVDLSDIPAGSPLLLREALLRVIATQTPLAARDEAVTAAQSALAYLGEAEAARDATAAAALVGRAARASTIAAAIVTARAAAADGEVFAAGGDDVDYIGVYLRTGASTQTEIGKVPAQALVSLMPGAPSFVVKDGNDELLALIGRDEIEHPHIAAIEALANVGQSAAARALKLANGQSSGLARLLGQVCHFVGWGQSNGNHMGARRDIRSFPDDACLMPNGGPSWRGMNLATDVLPAVGYVSTRPIWTCGYEAIFRMVAQLLRDEDGIVLTSLGQSMLISSAAKNGASMASLAGADYARFGVDLDEGKVEAGVLSKTWHPAGVFFVHGETDQSVLYGGPVSTATYLAGLVAMQAQMEATAQAKSGMTLPLPMLISQLGSHVHQSVNGGILTLQPPNVALAQLAADDLADICCIGPTYHLPYEDGQHFTGYNDSDLNGVWPHGYEWLGAYFGIALKRWYFDGVKPKALAPNHVAIMGNSLVLTFNVDPGRRLVLDTSAVPPQSVNSNMGFTVDDGSGTPIAVTGVALMGADKVVLKLASTPSSAAKVRYGWTNDAIYAAGPPPVGNCGAGNLRDDNPLIFNPGMSGYAMHKWCCIFEKGVTP